MDPSILRAREHVVNAEAAERDADRALDEARRRVKEARQHVKTLEDEAREEARLAKIKQHHAAEVSKRGKGLGRKFSLLFTLNMGYTDGDLQVMIFKLNVTLYITFTSVLLAIDDLGLQQLNDIMNHIFYAVLSQFCFSIFSLSM